MKDLSHIIWKGNLKKAKKLLENGYDINSKYGELGFYPICSAMNSDNPIESLKFVIENGADVNIERGYPLSEAFDLLIDGMSQSNKTEPFHEDVSIIKILIEQGADLEIKDANGLTPFSVINYYSNSYERFVELKNIFSKIIPNIDKYLTWKN
ncbi:ankyrin repeat domain-containing protein [Psychroserpens sp. S379A]|uniref:ankyrin repeat domain-containing protein n=1 Tax=Psychroserpens sp. S379A TaxID=3415137 RepID=UPI003C7A6627